MSDLDVIRAWRDPHYRRSLSADELARLPENPAGLIELSDDELRSAGGVGGDRPPQTTAINCTLYSFLTWKACGCGGPQTTAPTCTMYSFGGWKACGC
jgi:mersacidin/lichenicidin family type 2 lantibiotic